MDPVRYDTIGHDYAATRRDDPALRARIIEELGDSRTVVNVGAGAGSYEPRDRHVIAIEPSDVMAAQRPSDLVPALRASAVPLPLRDDSVDSALAILTIHHWDDQLEAGVRELRRVTRGPVIIVTFDTAVSSRMWLVQDYLPEVARLDEESFPTITDLETWLGGTVTVDPFLTSRESPDWNFASFWAHPERVFDPAARRATSGFARLDEPIVARALSALESDLQSGAWDERNGHLRQLDEFDAGMRIVVARP